MQQWMVMKQASRSVSSVENEKVLLDGGPYLQEILISSLAEYMVVL